MSNTYSELFSLEEAYSVIRMEGLMKQFQTNVFGTMNVTYAVLPYMRERKSGTVVLIGSRSAIRNEFGVRLLSLMFIRVPVYLQLFYRVSDRTQRLKQQCIVCQYFLDFLNKANHSLKRLEKR